MKDENNLNFSALILPLFSSVSWLLHYYNTHKIKLNNFPVQLWSNLSIGYEIKFIPHFLRFLCVCQHSVRPTPLLTETCSLLFKKNVFCLFVLAAWSEEWAKTAVCGGWIGKMWNEVICLLVTGFVLGFARTVHYRELRGCSSLRNQFCKAK